MRNIVGFASVKATRRLLVSFLSLSLLLALTPSSPAQSNGVLREVWMGIGGTAVSDLTSNPAYPSSPSFEEVLTTGFEAPTDVYDDYGQRLQALLIPPTTGTYYFLISSDDASQLFISTNDNPANERLIAQVTTWTSARNYHEPREAGQKSAAVSLVANQRYYIEALMKEGGGGDNLAVTWQKPGEGDPADNSPPIPNANLVPFGLGPPVFIVHPANAAQSEGDLASFTVQLQRASGATYQWIRNGTNIPGATAANLTLGPLRLSDNGSTLYCRAVNSAGATNSNPASLSVSADTTRPTIASAQSPGELTLVTVSFSERIDPATAGITGNYLINNGVGISSATLMDDGATVLLRTTSLTSDATYTLTVSNVRDLAQTPNYIQPGSQRIFTVSYTPLPAAYVNGTIEPAGPSSRRTPLAITEIMYHPTNHVTGRNLEFIEIYNSNPWVEDLSGHRLSGDANYTFPAGTTIPAQGYRLIAPNPVDVQAVYGLANVLGPLTNSTPGNTTNVLDNGGGMLRLRDELDSVLLEVTYGDKEPWPVAADGAGHSLTLARPSYGEGDPRAWAASQRRGGTPGGYDAESPAPAKAVLINEILAHTDPPQEDYIELYNYSASTVALSGCVLTDDPTTNRFRFAAGASIPARGYLALTQTQLGFALNAAGEALYFISADGTRVLDCREYGAQENGVAFGRFPDGAAEFRRLSSVTLGAANNRPLLSDIVINEVQYEPASQNDGEEYVEIYNRGTSSVNLGKWRLSGGISFTFPTNTTLAPGGYLVVAGNAAEVLLAHPTLSPASVAGSFSGKLANGGDVVRLDKLDDLVSTNQLGQWITNKIHIVVDEITYETGGRWGRWSGGGGSSLERTDPRGAGNLAPSWADSDETAKSGWTTVEFTGTLDNGAMASADQLQLFLLGPGECLIDNVEVIPQGGANQVVNGTFDAGIGGWFFQGTHEQSGWQATGGVSGGCLRVVASDRGDPGGNRIRTVLNQTLSGGTVATLRARVRWLKGHPEILLRLHGNWLEATGEILATRDFGSPGGPNTKYRANAGPAITDASHSPVLPAAGTAVTVTARMEDPNGVAQAVLKYRIDPASNYVSVPMIYCGAGYYSGVIPGQGAGVKAAFYLEARDAASPSAASSFPNDAPVRECVVVFGETTPAGAFGTYRLWVTQRNVTRWAAREKQSNHPLDATFVYGGIRAWYNVGTLYSGSPWHTPGYNSPDGNLCDYEVNFAKDEEFLGNGDFLLATVGNLNSDPTYQAEQAAFWIGRKMGAPYLHRRHIQLFFNGLARATLYEDSQQPDGEVVDQFYPDDNDGNLHKIEDWFEFDDAGNKLGNVDATLQNFTTTGGVKKTARYRWNWRPRATTESASAFTNLFALVDAMNQTQSDLYRSAVGGLVDVDPFMSILAMERIAGNWDSYGYNRGKNMYTYKPKRSGWVLMPWDIDFVFNYGGDGTTTGLFGSNEPMIDNFRAYPDFQRAYWRAFEVAVNGPMQAATFAARVDPRYNAMVAMGIGVASPQGLKDYVAGRRSYILSQLATVASTFTVNSSVTVSNGLGVLRGTAPVGVSTVAVNGAAWTVQWTSVTSWMAMVPLQTGSNYFSVVGLNTGGVPIAGASNAVSTIYNVPVPSPAGAVVINEIMFNPQQPEAEYIELFNTSTTNAFDLSGWTLNGLSYTFPNGASIRPRGYLVLARDRSVFNACYGPAILVFGEYSGNLQSDGETVSLLKPTTPAGSYLAVDQVRYEAAAPWVATTPGTALQLIDATQDNSRAANWAIGNASARATPGAANSVASTLPAFPTLWLNEAHAENLSGPFDNAGKREPWIELFNPGTNALNLTGYYLSDTYTNLGKWAFPANFSVPARSFAVVWCDGETGQTTPAAPHTSFRLAPAAGQVALSRLVNSTVQLVDYLTYTNLAANWSYGDLPDAQPFHRDVMFHFTAGATNSAASPPLAVFINEWMADNALTLTDPADNDPEDWFEIYNPGATTVDLGGFYLTDNLTNKFQFMVPDNGHYRIPPGGFLLVWADNETGQNDTNRADLHAGFALSKEGDAIGIFAADGTRIDSLSFSNQASDVSEGRFQDGQPGIYSMTLPTPGQPNRLANSPPILAPISDQELTLGQTLVFTVSASDADVPTQMLIYSLGAGAPPGATINSISGQFSWKPSSAPATNTFLVVVTDSGVPALNDSQTIRVKVHAPPTISVQVSGSQMQLSWPRGMLQEADEAAGPYHDVTTQSPLTVDLTEARKFYRVRL